MNCRKRRFKYKKFQKTKEKDEFLNKGNRFLLTVVCRVTHINKKTNDKIKGRTLFDNDVYFTVLIN